jgi:hypothetical protein
LAVASNNGTVGILLGNGDGTFQTQVDYPVDQNPSSIAVGDFNGDGKPDLAVTNSISNTVSVLFGNGDGTFQAKVDYGTGLGPSSVAVGDFNGDGKLDLAVANNQNNSVSIFLNSGTGTFAQRRDFDTGFTPTSVAVGDFNGDQKLDVAVADCGNNGGCYDTNGAVSVLLGNGDGTLQAAVNYAAGVGPVQVVAEDLNGDGILDLATANQPAPAQQSFGSASVLFGNGDGTFQPQRQYTAGYSPSSVVVADFNGDGQMDFGIINAAEETVGIYLNQGGGVFSLPTLLYGAGGVGGAAVTADFNQDHNADIAVICETPLFGTYFACFLLGNGKGAFPSTPLNYTTGDHPSFAAIADLNGDGKNDVVVSNKYDGDVSVFLGYGDGTFQTPVTYGTASFPSSVAIGDLNGDGKPDLAVANQTSSSVSVLLNNGNGTFQAHLDYATIGDPSFVAIGDVNGDGKPDLVATCPGSNAISIILGNGDGTFQPHTDFGGVGNPTSVALGDFNGDGKLDLAVANNQSGPNGSTPAASVLLNNGNGTFGESSFLLQAMSGGYLAIAAADLNGDGKLDLIVTSSGFSTAVLLGNGDGTFQAPTYSTGTGGATLTLGDFNHDGSPDVAVGEAYGVSLLLGNGDGTLRRALRYSTAGGGAVAAGDLNGDGSLDLAVANGELPSGFGSSNLLTILLNTGQTAASFKLAVSPTSQTVSAGNPASFTGTATSVQGFNSSVSLTCTPPSGLTCTVNPTSVVPTASGTTATVTVNTFSSTSVGTYALAITGTSGSEEFTVKPELTVNPALFDLGVVPGDLKLEAGSSATAMVGIDSVKDFSGAVLLTCTGQPSGSSCILNPASVTLGPSAPFVNSTLTVTTSASTPASTYTLMVTGTSGSVQHSTGVFLTVQSFAVSAPKSLMPNSVTPGQSAMATVTVSAAGGFGGAVDLTCSVSPNTAPAPTCSFNPAQVGTPTNGQATSTLTVSTTGPTAILLQTGPRRGGPPIYAVLFPIFGLALLGVGLRPGHERRRKLLGFAICCLLIGGPVFQVACGGGGGGGGTSKPGTLAGNYTVTITGTSGSPEHTQHTTTTTLTVQ